MRVLDEFMVTRSFLGTIRDSVENCSVMKASGRHANASGNVNMFEFTTVPRAIVIGEMSFAGLDMVSSV